MTFAPRFFACLGRFCAISLALAGHFTAGAERQVIPYLPHSDDDSHTAFVRATNQDNEDASISARAYASDGSELGESLISIEPGATIHVTIDNLTQENNVDNVTAGIELGETDWWLELNSESNVELHSYARASNGLSSPMHHLPSVFGTYVDVPNFVIGTAGNPYSRLRIVNPSSHDVVVSVLVKTTSTESVLLESVSIDARGAIWLSGEVAETPDESVEGLGSLEVGTRDLEIRWAFEEHSEAEPVVLHLMQSPDKSFTNMPGRPQNKFTNRHVIPTFRNAQAEDSYGLLRIWNHSNASGVAQASIRDDDGRGIGPIELTIDAVATEITQSVLEAAFDARDLNWPDDEFIQIELMSELELDVFSFYVQSDGLFVPLYETAPNHRIATRVVYFETDSGDGVESLLRVINPSAEEALVTIYGSYGTGRSSGDVSFSLKAFGARTIVESELTSGGIGIDGRLGNSSTDWQLYLISDKRISAMSLTRSTDGDLTNLSAAPHLIKETFGSSFIFQEAVSPNVVQTNCINCHVARGFAQNTRLVFVDSGAEGHRARNRSVFAEFLRRHPNGVEWILGKVQGGNRHGGGRRLGSDSTEFKELERFLTLLADEEGVSTGICGRSAEIRNVLLEKLDQADCGAITGEDLRSIGVLETGPLSEIEADDFRGLRNLTSLTLCSDSGEQDESGSSLASLPTELLAHLPRLDALQIIGCSVDEIPDGFFQDVTLGHLSIDAPLQKLPELPNFTLTGSHNADLLLSNLRLNELPDYGFAHKGLRHIEISKSESLTGIGDLALSGLQTLESLSIDGTSMAELSPRSFSDLNSLNWLHVANNEISTIPEDMVWPSRLALLNLNGNPITRLASGMFGGLSELEDLLIENAGPLTNGISDDAFDGLTALETLQLADSGIEELPEGAFEKLANLKSIRLQHNDLEGLPDGLFNGLTSLQSIELTGNPGAPFELLLELKRIDGELLGPSPSEIQLNSSLGFPFDGQLGLNVHNGSVSQNSVPFTRGSTSTSTIDVVQSDESQGTQVVLGPLVVISDSDSPGLDVNVDQPTVLFQAADNLMPMPHQLVQPRKIQVSAASWEYTFDGCFSDADDDSLSYSAVAAESGIVDIHSSANGINGTPVTIGSTVIEVSATDTSGLSVAQSFVLTVEPEPDHSSFQIHIDYSKPVSERISGLMSEAISRWEEIITDDIADVPVIASSDCTEATDSYTGDIDDLRIAVSTSTKPSDFTALARVNSIREESKLPLSGTIVLNMNTIDGRADDDVRQIFLHELAHTLGFTDRVWEEHGLLRNPSQTNGAGADTHFAGPRAIRAFDAAGGTDYSVRSKVPLENSGISHSDSHWAFSELMDVAGSGALSAITIEQFGDLGYVVDVSQADEFTLPSEYTGSSASRVGFQSNKHRVGSNVRGSSVEQVIDFVNVPLKIVDKQGQTVRVVYPNLKFDD